MKSFFSNIKKDMVGNALLFLLVGLILLVFPVSVSKIACYACGIILLFYGLQLLHAYFTMSFSQLADTDPCDPPAAMRRFCHRTL